MLVADFCADDFGSYDKAGCGPALLTLVPSWSAAVCVPVRDEVALLPGLLDALAEQQGAEAFVLCLLFDGCRDESATLVAERAPDLPFVVVTAEVDRGEPNAGLARRRAMDLGIAGLGEDQGHRGAMIVSLDADSLPDRGWLAANAAALAHADVVAGRVVRASGQPSPTQDRLDAYFDALFALRRAIDPVPWEAPYTHHCTSGASLAFRVEAYRALGGFEPFRSAEDARLVDRAHRLGLRVRRDAAVRVETSSRREGRATEGFAEHLRRLDQGETRPLVAHPGDAAWRHEREAAARRAWPSLDLEGDALARMFGCDPAHVARVAAEAINAEAFAMRVVPGRPGGERLVTLDEAEIALDRLCGAEQARSA